jgi:hypothetical protein
LLHEACFETLGAVAVAAGPRFSAIFIFAFATGVGVLDFHKIEKLFPVWPLFLERHVAVADFDPASRNIAE